MDKLNELLREYAQSIRRDDGTAFMRADAIRDHFRSATAPTMSEADAKDATRYRWLRAQHEMKEEFEDAEGFVVRETVADAWTVFRPGSVTSLEPVGCIPGELDAAIDAEIERIDRAAAKGESDE